MARAGDPVAEAAGRFLDSFQCPTTLLIAVSGGSDSVGLLVALATLSATGRYPHIALRACTVDHGLRDGSSEEAGTVAALCVRYGVPHAIRRWEGPKPATGLQAAARGKRYALLVEAAGAAGANAILAAHTRDDQRETVAMRAARAGEGVGLSGMADAVLLEETVWLLRPFLGVGRAAIRDFLIARHEGWIDDPSNLNRRFERVRVRVRGQADAARSLPSDDRLALAQRAADFLAGFVRADRGCFSLPSSAVEAALADSAAWRGLLLLAAAAGGRIHVLETRSAERLRAFLASGTLSRLTAGRIVFDRRRDGLHLYRECRGIAPLTLPAGETGLWDGRYRFANRTGQAIVVSARGEAGEKDAGGLHGPALRALRAAPCLTFEGGGMAAIHDTTVEPVVAPYADFLPRFDLPVAQALADILGRRRFVSPPNE